MANSLSKQSWEDYAACDGLDQSIFFPDKGQSTYQAKKICSTCSVRHECLDFALRDPKLVGVWGGRTENERKYMRRTQSMIAVFAISSSSETHNDNQTQ